MQQRLSSPVIRSDSCPTLPGKEKKSRLFPIHGVRCSIQFRLRNTCCVSARFIFTSDELTQEHWSVPSVSSFPEGVADSPIAPALSPRSPQPAFRAPPPLDAPRRRLAVPANHALPWGRVSQCSTDLPPTKKQAIFAREGKNKALDCLECCWFGVAPLCRPVVVIQLPWVWKGMPETIEGVYMIHVFP